MVENYANRAELFIQPKQILFLSADLVGSTAMKQKRRNKDGVNIPDTQDWALLIQRFYSAMSSVLKKNWESKSEELENSADLELGADPILWKTVGDEVIFRKYISSRIQVVQTISLWIDTVKAVRGLLQASSKDKQIELKCTAWLAEFPIQNRVVLGTGFAEADPTSQFGKINMIDRLYGFEKKAVEKGEEIDFIGPAIDIGFRLTKQATARKFMLSIDTAFLLLYKTIGDNKLRIRYDGSIRLSGVFGGIAYPLFWIDMSEKGSSEFLEDQIHRVNSIDREKAEDFCRAFYQEKSNFIDPPFILTDTDKFLKKEPPWYQTAKKEALEGYSAT